MAVNDATPAARLEQLEQRITILESREAELRRENQRLRRHTQAYRSIIRNTADGYCLVDGRGRLQEVNRVYSRMSGYSRRELLAMEVGELDPLCAAELLRLSAHQPGGEGYHRFESRHRHRDGEFYDVECRLIRIKESDLCILFTRDIGAAKQTEKELRESTSYLESIFRAAPTGIGVVVNRGIVQVNDRFLEMTGYSREEILNQESTILYPSRAEYEYVGREKYLQIKEFGTGTVETRWKTKDNRIIDVLLSSTPLERGDLSAGVTFTALDISKRTRAIKALARAEQRWRHILVHTPQLGVSLDREGTILFANDFLLELSGWQHQELLGRNWFSLFLPPESREEVAAWFQGLLAVHPGQDYSCREYAIVTRNGLRRNISWSNVVSRSPDGRVLEVTSLGVDLTERQRAEQKVRETAERFQGLFGAINDAVLVHPYRAEGFAPFVEVNDLACRRYGYSREEFLQRTFLDLSLLTTRADDSPISTRERLLQQGHCIFEDQHLSKEGDSFPVEINAKVVEMSGQPMILSVVRDISGRKQAEAERQRLEAELRQAQRMESIGRLAGGVAHDFNNMLSVILGYSEIALAELAPEEPLHRNLSRIQRAAAHSADLTGQLLTFARKQTVSPRVLDLNETITTMHGMLERLIGEEISFEWLAGEDLWPVKMDPTQVDQVLVNLCLNARDAIQGIGTIMVSTANSTVEDEERQRTLGVPPGSYVLLRVADSGKGMAAGEVDHIFEPFYTTKEVGRGTGLGLATVYGILKQNNCHVRVSSDPGQGSVFDIYLPRVGESVPLLAAEGSGAEVQAGGQTILVVEDEPAILNMVTTILGRKGYTVLSASAPAEAIRLVRDRDQPLQLLITDVIMPEMNGRELADHLLDSRPSLEILFISGYTADVISSQGILEEAVNFLQKPFTLEELLQRVGAILEKGDAPAGPETGMAGGDERVP
ncbi:PAS domain-containing hybrid sensor histidine kinase/response regulator [Desulfogranum mediterraneum]|uniref:PAS domain-containing hybrid sensor histidine kinase/response regulator n=1 Tax=Desulfogranum mediterraneum TaxID=160661 RepID=UPI0003F4F373|nr:PAS domain S-box protein [Desulfogranum mediterraneum]